MNNNTAVEFADFLRKTERIVRIAAQYEAVHLIDFEAIEMELIEFFDSEDTADIMAEEEFEMDVYDEYDEP